MSQNNEEFKNEEDLLDDYFGKEENEVSPIKVETLEQEEGIDDLDVFQDNFPKDKKVKQHARAVKMVAEAKQFVTEADEHIESSKLLLENDLEAYEKAKQALYDNGLRACIIGLKGVGSAVSAYAQKAESSTVYKHENKSKTMHVKGVSRSKFASFVFSLIFGLLAALAFIFVATKFLGMSEENTDQTLSQNFESIMTWYATLIGMEGAMFGLVVYLFGVSLVIFLVYLLRNWYKSSSNLHFAAKQLAEAELFHEIQQDEKYKLDQIDAHVKECIVLFEKYAIFCNEQQGKLQRILYVEGEKKELSEYNMRSSREITRTAVMTEHILEMLAEPVSKDGQLSQKSVHLLAIARDHLDKVIERLYRVRRDDRPRV